VNFLTGFFRDRRGRVRLDGVVGPEFGLDRGAPMGTILGPFGWLLVMDDLLERLETGELREVLTPGPLVRYRGVPRGGGS
jgi:hypothetical protein